MSNLLVFFILYKTSCISISFFKIPFH